MSRFFEKVSRLSAKVSRLVSAGTCPVAKTVSLCYLSNKNNIFLIAFYEVSRFFEEVSRFSANVSRLVSAGTCPVAKTVSSCYLSNKVATFLIAFYEVSRFLRKVSRFFEEVSRFSANVSRLVSAGTCPVAKTVYLCYLSNKVATFLIAFYEVSRFLRKVSRFSFEVSRFPEKVSRLFSAGTCPVASTAPL